MTGAIAVGLVALAVGLGAPTGGSAQLADVGARANGVEVLLSTEEAVREVFPSAATVVLREWRPTAGERRGLEERLDRRLFEPAYPFLLLYDAADRLVGYALVTDERGKYRPITFLVGVSPTHTVQGVTVMMYRESRGGEVRRNRFLVQYRDKTAADPIRINRDIINISGATISVRSMNAGVRKVLALVETAFDGAAPRLTASAKAQPIARLP